MAWTCKLYVLTSHRNFPLDILPHSRLDATEVQNTSTLSVLIGMMITRTSERKLLTLHNSLVHDLKCSCKFTMVYFVGKPAGRYSGLKYVLEGNFTENVNAGKTWEWFAYANKLKYNIVVKMDIDTVVDWKRFCVVLERLPFHERLYIGR
eukprot:35569-Hanusia_phi.AAC.1